MAVGFKMDLNHWDPRIEAQRSWFISRQPYLDRLMLAQVVIYIILLKKQNAVVFQPNLHYYQ